jgi:hypothetical protein
MDALGNNSSRPDRPQGQGQPRFNDDSANGSRAALAVQYFLDEI